MSTKQQNDIKITINFDNVKNKNRAKHNPK